MKVAATAAEEEDLPDVATLLREGSFQQRMEAARKQRERVLALQAAEAGEQTDLVVLHKPWGKQGWEARQPPGSADAPLTKVVAPAPNERSKGASGAARLPAIIEASEVPSQQANDARRIGRTVVRTSWGFALGLGLGIAVATVIPFLRSQDAPSESAAVPAAAPPAPTADAGVPSTVEVSPAAASVARRDLPEDESAAIIAPGPDKVVESVAPVFSVPAAKDSEPASDISAEPILRGLSDWSPEPSAGVVQGAGEQGLALPGGDETMARGVVPLMPELSQTADLPVAEPAPPPVVSAPVGAEFSAAEIHIHLSSGVGAGEATSLAVRLGEAGFNVTETAETGVTIRETNVRYYHPADADAARALAAQLQVTARDFTGTSPAPPPGLIEVWVKGPATGKAAATEVKKVKTKAKKKKAAAPAIDPAASEAQELQALRDRLLKQLQSGTSP